VSAKAGLTVIVGLMGAGKTTVGRALAEARGVPFFDNDALLEAHHGRTAARLATDIGVPGLHAAEADVALAALHKEQPSVVALAASTADDRRVLDALRGSDVVWLRAEPSTLRARTAGRQGHRPSAQVLGETVEQQSARRADALASVARVIVDVDGRTPGDVVAAIMRADQRVSGRDDLPPASVQESGSSPS
jgi:shikimate kinase